jgi:hypothetical protein
VARMGGEKIVQGFGGKARRPRRRWAKGIRGSWGHWLEGCRLDSTGSRLGSVASFVNVVMNLQVLALRSWYGAKEILLNKGNTRSGPLR